jgi:hypothetical protein
MPAPTQANRPRWRGQPGFFEIWFLVVFDPGAARAWWFRYTTFAPASGQPGTPRATLWAAAFDAASPQPALAGKQILPIDAYAGTGADDLHVRLGSAALGQGVCTGRVDAGGHTIAWDLAFTPAAREARRGPWLLHHLPLPTRVEHANSEITFRGCVSVDGTTHTLDAAPGIQKHIWGTRRVEELFWLYCPRFAEDPTACLEATSARLHRPSGPALAPVWLRTRDGTIARTGLAAALRNRIEVVASGTLGVHATSATREIVATAHATPDTLAGYVYRDPAGWDVYVAQSDIATCELTLRRRPHPLASWGPAHHLTARHGAALEFHALEPLPGVHYIPWDASA